MSSCASLTLTILVATLPGIYTIHSCDGASNSLNILIVGESGVTVCGSPPFFLLDCLTVHGIFLLTVNTSRRDMKCCKFRVPHEAALTPKGYP